MKKPIRNLLVITSYPKKGSTHGPATVGIASYAKNTLRALQAAAKEAREPLSITVLAEQLTGQRSIRASDEGVIVGRLWQRDNAHSFVLLILAALRHPAKDVLIECEVAMFGRPITAILFPLLAGALRLAGKHVTIVCHQVIRDVNELSGHINIEPATAKTDFLNVLVRLFYSSLQCTAHRIVVFEDVLKQYLSPQADNERIVVIPHGIEPMRTRISKRRARKQLGLSRTFTILVFGFLAWYKGTDWIAHAVAGLKGKQASRIRLILAGGPNPNHAEKPYYRRFLTRIAEIQKAAHGRISVVGFVPEKDIPLYFTAADVVVFPYRTLMSASGPMALAYTFGKPTLISQPLQGILQAADMKRILGDYGIMKEESIFPLTQQGFAQSIKRFIRNKSMRTKLSRLSVRLAESRNFEVVGKQYYEVLFRYTPAASVAGQLLDTLRTFWPYASQTMVASPRR